MTLQEISVPSETPVRLPTHIREDAFFYKMENRAVLNGTLAQLFFTIPYQSWNHHRFLLVLGSMIILMIALALFHSSFWIVVFLLGLMVSMAFPIVDKHKRNQHLKARFHQEGYIVQGEIVSCVASVNQFVGTFAANAFVVEVDYRFTAPDGDIFRSSITEPRPDLNGTQLPAPGTPVYVLYFNERECYLL